MAISIQFPSLPSNSYIEGPTGLYTPPTFLVETLPGLYVVSPYLVEGPLGLYTIPATYLIVDQHRNDNLISFSVQEDATPIDPSSSFGGVGQITATLDDFTDSHLLLGEIILGSGDRGKTSGTIRNLSSRDGILTITADSVLGLFNANHTAMPQNTTLGAAIQYYCDLVGIPNDVLVDASLTSRSVIYPGWIGNAWTFLKQLLIKEQIELALVYDRIYVRPLHGLVVTLDRTTSQSWSANNQTAAKKIEIYYYNHTYGTQSEVYPLITEDATIYQVDAGQTITFTQQLNASLSSVNQPTCVDFVNDTTYAGTNGVYAVSGNDGLPITAAQWVAQGGSLSVKVTDDPSIIEVTITGSSMPDYAPYRIAMSSGSSNFYNALHITGTGVTWDKKLITIPTGAPSAITSQDVGVTIDNPYVSTLAQAYTLGMRAAASYSGTTQTLSGSATDINQAGAGAALVQPTFADFNTATVAGSTFADFNALWSGKTFTDFNTYWEATVADLWANQAYGNAPGARVLEPDVNYRVTSVTTTESSVQFTADSDTIMSDFNSVWNGLTFSDFNTQFAGKKMKDFDMTPLRKA